MVIPVDVCIKNINEELWREFKAEAIKHRLKIGAFFNKLIYEHEQRCKGSNWENILYGEKKLKGMVTKEEGVAIREEFRKQFALRGEE